VHVAWMYQGLAQEQRNSLGTPPIAEVSDGRKDILWPERLSFSGAQYKRPDNGDAPPRSPVGRKSKMLHEIHTRLVVGMFARVDDDEILRSYPQDSNPRFRGRNRSNTNYATAAVSSA